ncbi:hypothetical protein FRB98_008114 [Tulasnella sp. 332]|nr:hypothetical protein FRB98_008114 [Tulasnella sp. 332]
MDVPRRGRKQDEVVVNGAREPESAEAAYSELMTLTGITLSFIFLSSIKPTTATSPIQQPRVEAKYNVVTEYPNLRLHGAAAKGDIGLVQYALTHGQPANSVLDGILPLHAACSGGSELVVKLLIDFGADVDAPRLPRRYCDKKSEGGTIIGSSGSTPLHFAAANGHLSIVKILLSQGASASRADKHGTKAENLATNFGHDEVATFLKDWEIEHPPLPTTPPEVSRRSSHEGQPPSPQKSKKIHMKRSLENLLGRKPHGSGTSTPSLTPLALDMPITATGYSASNGSLTPATPEVFGPFAPSASRRPSLPQIFEKTPTGSNPSPLGSPSKPTFHRPLSSGGLNTSIPEGDLPPIASSSSSPMVAQPPPHTHGRLRSKISMLNIFNRKASTPTSAITMSPASYGASSPNLLAPGEQLGGGDQSKNGTLLGGRQRSSIDEGRPSFSGSTYTRHSFERERAQPGTAPALQTTFQQRSNTGPIPIHAYNQYNNSRTARSNSQPRSIGFDHLLRPRNDSMASSSSSFSYDSLSVSHRNPYAYPASHQVVVVKTSRKKDRSVSEGASARLNRLMSETLSSDWPKDVKREKVVLDDDGEGADDDEEEADERRDVLGGYRRPGESGDAAPRRPSLPMTRGSGDSTEAGSIVGHNRTSSTQSAKNLRFAELPPSPSSNVSGTPPQVIQQVISTPPSSTAPQRPLPSPIAPTIRGIRTCVSLGSLQHKRTLAMVTAGSIAPDEEEAAVVAAEGADSLGELYDDPRSGVSGRPTLVTSNTTISIGSPTASTPSSAAMFSPETAGTTSGGGRSYSVLQKMLGVPTPDESPSVGGGLKPSEADSRLRGASISSSKSTETTSTTTATSESSGGNTSISMGASTAKIGSNGTAGSVRSLAVRNASGNNSLRRPSQTGYEIEDGGDSDSMSSTREYKLQQHTAPNSPIPIMLRNVNSHAQAHALVEKAEKDILSLAELPPNSAGLSGDLLAAQLAAFGETLALEKRFAKGEKQRMVWLRDAEDEGGLGSDGDEEDAMKAFAPPPPTRRKSSGAGAAGDKSPMMKRAGSLEFDRVVAAAANAGMGRTKSQRGGKLNTPTRNNASFITPTNNVIRTTPSNVGPPVVDLNVKSAQHGSRHLNHLVLGSGIEITETLPTPTDSPRSTVETSTVGGHDGDASGDIDPDDFIFDGAERMTSPEHLEGVPLERVNTAPSAGSGYAFTTHGRTSSTGSPLGEPKGTIGKKLGGGFRGFVQTLKGKS